MSKLDAAGKIAELSADEYRQFLSTIDMTQMGFAELLGYSGRAGQVWATRSVPPAVALIVRLLERRPEVMAVIEEIQSEHGATRVNLSPNAR